MSFITLYMDASTLPLPGDRLFQKSPRSTRRDREGSWLAYAAAYKKAADDLVNAQPSPIPEANAYPIVFLYRHYLELEMKSVVALDRLLQTLHDEEDDARARVEQLLATHDLVKLSKGCCNACSQMGPDLFPDELRQSLRAFETCAAEIATHDPGSFAFRYPVDRKLNPNLTRLQGIDLPHLKKMIDKMACFIAIIRQAIQRRIHWAGAENEWTDEDEVRYFKDITGQDEEEAQRESRDE